MKKLRVLICTMAVLLLTVTGLTHAQGPGPEKALRDQAALLTAFTYQGRLTDGDGPVDGSCTFWFSLYDEEGIGMPPSGGTLLGTIQTGLPVRDGIFTAALNFGAGMFSGERRWLEIDVDCGDGRVELSPRQELTPAPYAFYAPEAGAVPWGGVSDVPGDLDDGDDDTLAALSPSCAHGQIAEWNEEGQAWECGDDDSGAGGDYWSLTGNAGTDPSTQFVGTSDAEDLRLAVNGVTALRLGATAGTPNLVGGYAGNSVGAGVVGATVGGGGYDSYPNGVTRDYGTVGGGAGNAARGDYATVGGGAINASDGSYAMIGGGRLNSAGGDESAVGGGKSNDAAGAQSTIAGGESNEAEASYGAVGGGQLNAARGDHATVAGGHLNTAQADYAAVGGGTLNSAWGTQSTVGGGAGNFAASSATVGGGVANTADGDYATVGGGYWITATGDYATVAGGKLNTADGTQSTVGGGADNHAGYRATVAGGLTNEALGSYSTIGGGHDNDATASYAAVVGGKANQATGQFSVAPGGYANVASGDYSFAAGHKADAVHDGAFVWADNYPGEYYFDSAAPNEFSARATGGVRFVLGLQPDGGPGWTCSVADGSTWSCASDRTLKENLTPVDEAEILARLGDVPIYTWNGIGADPAVQHMGPMAQDFYAAFGVGEDERQIATIDLDGVALAAIQGLQQLAEERAARIEALEAKSASQQAQIDELAARLAALEADTTQPVKSRILPSAGALLAVAGIAWVAQRSGSPRPRKGDR
jgi:hypothetical protein